VTVERPLRLLSQLSPKLIEPLRFASGDEELRREFYEQIGDQLFDDFASAEMKLAMLINERENMDEDEEEENGNNKSIPEKKKKKLLDRKTWERDSRLVDTANALRSEIGGHLFEDHNVFRDRVDEALQKLKIKISGSEVKTILRAVGWRGL
jgi:type I restriction enzyme M protein